MSNKSKEGLGRRDFIIASVAAAGASVALGANAKSAPAQGTGTFTADPAVINGKPVISALDVSDLEPGKKYTFFFEGVQMPTGQHWYVSVMVAKGAQPGKRVALVSGVHGDEMSSVHAIQTIMAQLDPAEMSGAVLAVFDVSRPAIEAMTRRWLNWGLGENFIDLNRVWPGNENGADAPTRHAGLLFNRLLKPNVDYALDFHTATTGLDMTAFNLARMDQPDVRAMAELFPIEQIYADPGYPGLLAAAFIEAGIPALTTELGGPRRLDKRMISMFVEGTMNVLKHHKIVAGPMGRTAQEAGTFLGNEHHTIIATQGGFVELLVELRDKVKSGQKVAVQRNSFGEVVAEYTSGVEGEVSVVRRDATSEPGNLLVAILYNVSHPDIDAHFAE